MATLKMYSSSNSHWVRPNTNFRFIVSTCSLFLVLIYIVCRMEEVANLDMPCKQLATLDDPNVTIQMEKLVQPIARFRGPRTFTSDTSNAFRYVFHHLGYRLEVNRSVFRYDGTLTDHIYKGAVPWTVDHPQSPDKVIDRIPGLNEYITNKQALVTRGGKYIPKAFYFPRDYKRFVRYISKPKNKNKTWIQKNPRFRGNFVKNFTELQFINRSLVQEYISNPFLVANRKFSMGMFVAFSSVRPLRAYVLDTFNVARFCGKPYDAANFNDPMTYITDGQEDGTGLNVLEMKDNEEATLLQKYGLNYQYGFRRSLEALITERGKNGSAIVPQIFDAIRDAINRSMTPILRHNVIANAKYFQYTRWDFVIDEDAKIHLIEANVNPHLDVNPRNPKYLNRFFYLILATTLRAMRMDKYHHFQEKKPSYLIRNSDVYIYNPVCYKRACNSCQNEVCHLCSHCLSKKKTTMLKEVIWENLGSRDHAKMVYPVIKDTNGAYYNHQTHANKLTTDWIRHKCKEDISWCGVY